MLKCRRKRGRLGNETNYSYQPSSHSFMRCIKIQSIIPQQKPQLVELWLCVCARVSSCVHVHEESEAHFRAAVLRLAAAKVCNEELHWRFPLCFN